VNKTVRRKDSPHPPNALERILAALPIPPPLAWNLFAGDFCGAT
jgi:hypothetical protein